MGLSSFFMQIAIVRGSTAWYNFRKLRGDECCETSGGAAGSNGKRKARRTIIYHMI